ncbi:MAG: GMC family oxidoreductase [Pseudomonadota bacterium]
MLVDAVELSQACLSDVDVCVVGAGAAGLSMAWRMRDTGVKVALLESGGSVENPVAPDDTASDLNAGVSIQSNYPFEASRARGIGGTTALWTGACVPLGPEDFEPRDWIPHSGWPINFQDLAPYYKQAGLLFDLTDSSSHRHLLEASPFHGHGLTSSFAQVAQNCHFGKRHIDWVSRSPAIFVIIGATVTGLDAKEGEARIGGVNFCDRTGAKHALRAKVTVLATGGIEVPRLLLSARSEIGEALGPAMHNVGRFHMEHPIRSLGTIKLPDAAKRVTAFTNAQQTDGAALLGIFSIDAETRAKERLLNIQFHSYRYNALEAHPAIMALKKLADPQAPDGIYPLGLASPANIARCARYTAWHFWNKSRENAWFDHIRLQAFVEQEPDRDNRITLSDNVDRFGQRLPHLHSTESKLFHDSIVRSLDILGRGLRAGGYSDFLLGADKVPHLHYYGGYGLHHMGGTRMSSDPFSGVVDKDCKVHGLSNLYVASSSVFPTGGAANPTLTICALVLRLADHLVKKVK